MVKSSTIGKGLRKEGFANLKDDRVHVENRLILAVDVIPKGYKSHCKEQLLHP